MDRRRGAVFLVGFMGSGKTTVGSALARLLAADFVDLDETLASREGRSVARIIEESGEPRFRDLETRLLSELRGRERLVVACGGGTYTHPPSRAIIDSSGTSVWLQVPLALALLRCVDGPARPLLRGTDQAEALFRARVPAYRLAALHVAIEGLSPEQAAERIASLL